MRQKKFYCNNLQTFLIHISTVGRQQQWLLEQQIPPMLGKGVDDRPDFTLLTNSGKQVIGLWISALQVSQPLLGAIADMSWTLAVRTPELRFDMV